MRGPVDLTQELLAADVAHEIVHLRRRIDDAAELPAVLGVSTTSCLAVRLYDTDAGPLAAFVPPGSVPATTALARALRCRAVRIADPARVSALTDSHPALVAPVGLPPAVRPVADAVLRDQEVVYTPTGDGSTALKIRTGDLLGLTGALVAPIVEPGAVDFAPADPGWRDDPLAGHGPAFARR